MRVWYETGMWKHFILHYIVHYSVGCSDITFCSRPGDKLLNKLIVCNVLIWHCGWPSAMLLVESYTKLPCLIVKLRYIVNIKMPSMYCNDLMLPLCSVWSPQEWHKWQSCTPTERQGGGCRRQGGVPQDHQLLRTAKVGLPVQVSSCHEEQVYIRLCSTYIMFVSFQGKWCYWTCRM